MALARDRKLPPIVSDFLNRFDISGEKATYVGQLYHKDGLHLYQFSYRFAGNILSEPENAKSSTGAEGKCCHEPYPYGALGFYEPHFDVEFVLWLPWVLDEPQ